jgi:hypothetical protein
MLLFDGLCIRRLVLRVRVDFRLVGVVASEIPMNLRQRQVAKGESLLLPRPQRLSHRTTRKPTL